MPDRRRERRGPLTTDEVFSLLKTRRRRDLLRLLREDEGTMTIGEAAERIAARENGVSRQSLSSDRRKSVYVGLHQCHLPKMDDAGVVDFDKNRGTIDLRARAEPLFDYLELERDGEDESAGRRRREAGVVVLTGVVTAVVLGGVAGLPVLSAVPASAQAVAATATAVLLAVERRFARS